MKARVSMEVRTPRARTMTMKRMMRMRRKVKRTGKRVKRSSKMQMKERRATQHLMSSTIARAILSSQTMNQTR